jgi:hypothetical protein
LKTHFILIPVFFIFEHNHHNMNERYKKGNIEYIDSRLGTLMFFNSKYLKECVKAFNEQGIKSATFAHSPSDDGYNEDNLDVLKEIEAKAIIVNPFAIKDFSGLNSQHSLTFLRIYNDPVISEINFDCFKKLESFEGYYTKHLKNFFFCETLKALDLRKYKSPLEDLTEFQTLRNLEDLCIVQSNISNCNGLDKLPFLRKLHLAYNRKLEVIGTADFTSCLIEEIVIEACKKFDPSGLKVFTGLKKIKFINNGKIAGLDVLLSHLPDLEEVHMDSTELAESDNLYFLKHPSLKNVFLEDKKHLYLKTKEINRALASPEEKEAILARF